MFDRSKIIFMDSTNVVENVDLMRKRFDEIKTDASKEQLMECVRIGGYQGKWRSFSNSRNRGRFSVRMVASLCEVFKINPLWLVGEIGASRDDYTFANVEIFLNRHNFQHLTTQICEDETKELYEPSNDFLLFFKKVFEGIDENDMINILSISSNDAAAMLKILFLTAEDSNRLSLIKILLKTANWPIE